MSHQPAVGRVRRAAVLIGLALSLAGCSQPGAAVSEPQAAKLTTATSDITAACGFAVQASAFPHQHWQRARLQSLAHQGAVQLARVDRTSGGSGESYQGETVGAIVNRSITLLSQCGLSGAAGPLRAAAAAQH